MSLWRLCRKPTGNSSIALCSFKNSLLATADTASGQEMETKKRFLRLSRRRKYGAKSAVDNALPSS